MKVVHVLGELRASGAEVMLRAAVPLFDKEGIETLVIATGSIPGAYEETFRSAGVRVIHVPFSKSLSFATAFVRALRTVRPDVVHIHTERANAALGWLARFAGTRIILRTVHNVFTYTGQLRVSRTIERASLRALGAQHITIGPSVEQNELRRLRNRTVRVDNWIDSRFRPPTFEERSSSRAQLGLGAGDYVISVIGNCSPVKNHIALLSALPEVALSPNRSLVCLHAGNDTGADNEKQLAAQFDNTVKVRFLGSVDDVREVLWASDAFCMPSLFEGLSIAALEALACGVPAVLAEVPGLVDTQGSTGGRSVSVKFIAPTNAGVVRGFQELFAEPAEAVARAALAAAKSVRFNHDIEVQVRKLIALYRGSRSDDVVRGVDEP